MDRRIQALSLVTALSLCAFVFFVVRGLATPHDFWFDETFSIVVGALPVPDFVEAISEDIHPPLYSLSLRLVQMVFGNSEIAIRLLSVVPVLAAVALCIIALWSVSRPSALIAGALFAVSGPVAFFALEARAYAFLIFFATAAPLAFALGRRGWFLTACLLLGLSHFFGTLLAIILLGLDAALRLKQRRPLRATLGIGVLVSIWPATLLAIRAVRGLNVTSWITTPPLGVPAEAAAAISPVSRFFARQQGVPGAEVLLVGVAFLACVLWLVLRWSALPPTVRKLALVSVASILGLIAAVMALSVLTPIASSRNFVCLIPSAAVLAGLAFGDLFARLTAPGAGLMLVLLVGYLAASAIDASRWQSERLAPRENYSWAMTKAEEIAADGQIVRVLIDDYFNVNSELATEILDYHTPKGLETKPISRDQMAELGDSDIVIYAHANMSDPAEGQRIGDTPAFVDDLRSLGHAVEILTAPQSSYPNTGVAIIAK